MMTNTSTDHAPTPARPSSSGASVLRPLAYHRLLLSPAQGTRWWRPLAVVGATVGLYLAFVLPLLILTVVAMEGTFGDRWIPTPELSDPSKPADMVVGLGMIALMVPAAALGMRWAGRAPGILHSVRRRVRWELLLRAAVVLLPLYALVNTAQFLVAPPADLAWPTVNAHTLLLYVLFVLLVPLQCAGEEYVFRGLPLQVFGTWLRSPLWGILIPVPLFVLAHGYDWVGQIDIAVFAVCMGALTWKSGGLECAIVLHTANNLTLFLLTTFSASSTLEQGAVDPILLLISLPVTLGSTAWLWWWVSRRYGVRALEPVVEVARRGATFE